MSPEPGRLQARLAGLVAFRTENPPGDEADAARWLGAELAGIGCDVDFQEVSPGRLNLVASLDNGAGPCLAFNSHFDVIPAGEGWTGDPFTLREKDGRLIEARECRNERAAQRLIGRFTTGEQLLHGIEQLRVVSGDQCIHRLQTTRRGLRVVESDAPGDGGGTLVLPTGRQQRGIQIKRAVGVRLQDLVDRRR